MIFTETFYLLYECLDCDEIARFSCQYCHYSNFLHCSCSTCWIFAVHPMASNTLDIQPDEKTMKSTVNRENRSAVCAADVSFKLIESKRLLRYCSENQWSTLDVCITSAGLFPLCWLSGLTAMTSHRHRAVVSILKSYILYLSFFSQLWITHIETEWNWNTCVLVEGK